MKTKASAPERQYVIINDESVISWVGMARNHEHVIEQCCTT